jgi:hypothetical protein
MASRCAVVPDETTGLFARQNLRGHGNFEREELFGLGTVRGFRPAVGGARRRGGVLAPRQVFRGGATLLSPVFSTRCPWRRIPI